jgi:thymidylate synthase (FAD)
MNVELLAITPNAEALIEQAYRICWGTPLNLETRSQFIKRCLLKGHETPTEHAFASFLVTDASRALLAQITRHRLASFSVASQRYISGEKFSYIDVPTMPSGSTTAAIYDAEMKHQQEVYKQLRSLGVAKEDARMVLGQGTTTNVIVTANFREWRHIFELRISNNAQWEIRNMCIAIRNILSKEAPSIFAAYV